MFSIDVTNLHEFTPEEIAEFIPLLRGLIYRKYRTAQLALVRARASGRFTFGTGLQELHHLEAQYHSYRYTYDTGAVYGHAGAPNVYEDIAQEFLNLPHLARHDYIDNIVLHPVDDLTPAQLIEYYRHLLPEPPLPQRSVFDPDSDSIFNSDSDSEPDSDTDYEFHFGDPSYVN